MAVNNTNTVLNEEVTQQELIQKTFFYLNSYKRHRALAEIKRQEKNYDKANYHQLKQYQFIDQLELALRAIQKGQRELDEE